MQPGQRTVHRGLVARHHLSPALAVALGDRGLYLLDCPVLRQHARDREEARLQHRVGPPGEAGIAGDPRRVDHVQLDALGHELLLDRARQGVPDLVRARGGC